MSKCKVGPWCANCKKSIEIKNSLAAKDYKNAFKSSCYILYDWDNIFITCYVCKEILKEICPDMELK